MHVLDQHDPNSRYIGRFAPSPSGPLHFGSLVCALASYLDARANNGSWLVRMEDIDPPREIPGSSDSILRTLEAHSLHWDNDVVFQSTHRVHYQAFLEELKKNNLTYRCLCSRKRLAALNHIYDGHCQNVPVPDTIPAAIRLNTNRVFAHLERNLSEIQFLDLIQGIQSEDIEKSGDFIIHRKDGLFAYQLAVAVDDVAQGITHVVRGIDLLNSTAKQVLLINLLGGSAPSYAHIPIIVNELGDKLSKQTAAPPVNDQTAQLNLFHAAKKLGLNLDSGLKRENCETQLKRMSEKWELSNVPKQQYLKI